MFATALKSNNENQTLTWNGALSNSLPDPKNVSNESSSSSPPSYNGRLSLFFHACRGIEEDTLREHLKTSCNESLVDTFVLAFHIRDCRGGKGERCLGRYALKYLYNTYPSIFQKLLPLVPKYGRWDDLFFLYDKESKDNAKDKDSLDSKNLVLQVYASQLKEDLQNMNDGKPCSLASKWLPSEKSSLNKKVNVYSSICKILKTDCKGLRKTFLSPLREYIRIVERYMCSGTWEKIDFNTVPSRAMLKLKKAFSEHQEERFKEWKENLAKGKTVIKAKQLMPHELIKNLCTYVEKPDLQILQAQWNVIVEEVRKQGSFKDMIAVVDTSSSMFSSDFLPLSVSVSIGMLISEIVEGKFHGHLLTFNTTPAFAVIPDSDVLTRFTAVRNMSWGGTTNIEATFKLILDKCLEKEVPPSEMPKKLVIISDMQFNECDYRLRRDGLKNGITNFQRIDEMYSKSGYTRPTLIFWNVQGAITDFPITTNDSKTCMISGFSPSIMKSFMKGEEITAVSVLKNVLEDKRYDEIRKAF
jgi:hypothetical protein